MARLFLGILLAMTALAAEAASRRGPNRPRTRRPKAAWSATPVQSQSPYAKPGTMATRSDLAAPAPAREHRIEAGAIHIQNDKGQALTNHKGVFQGPKDTLPNPNPGAGGSASGRTAITPNP